MSIDIRVDGRAVTAEAGMSVAAAMLNAGVTRFRTSVGGAARGPLCGMGVCHECRVTIDGVAHRRSCLIEASNGMRVDTGIVSPPPPSPRTMRTKALEADVVVVGAGPAGIAAAASAAERGVRVIILDESPRAGGQIWRHRTSGTLGIGARRWLLRLERSGARIMSGTTVSFARREGDQVILTAEQGGDTIEVRSRAMIIATGARELFLPFPGSVLPGVIGVGALQALIKNGSTVRDKRIVIAGTGPLLFPVAAAAAQRGAKVELVAEQAAAGAVAGFASGLWRQPASIVQAVRYRAAFAGTRFSTGTWVTRARGTDHLEDVEVTDGHATRNIPCDLLAAAHGLIPNTELARELGCATANGAVLVDDYLRTNVEGVYSAGELTGVGGVDLALMEGMIAGLTAAGARDRATAHVARAQRLRQMARRMSAAFALRPELRALATPDTIVCRCEDVAMSAITAGWTMRKAKLYTRAGMGACQGRTCGAALNYVTGAAADSIRLPIQPTLLTTLTALPPRGADFHDPGERHDGEA